MDKNLLLTTIIIGAGPAGSLAGILLARAGKSVTLIEQSRFPRDKVCGECLSALGRSVLARHRLEQPLIDDHHAIELTQSHLHSAHGTATLDLPEPMMGVSRAVLDAYLLNKAREAGVTVRQPARVERLWPVDANSPPAIIVRDLSSNAVSEVAADVILVATGGCSLFGEKQMPTGDLGIKTHFRNIDSPRNAIALFATDHCYGGIAPIENDRWNVAFSVPATLLKSAGGDIDAVFKSLTESNPNLARAMFRAERITDWLASPLPRYAVSDDWPPGIIPIGNSAAAIEPIGGEGMGLALRSAEIAVECLLAGEPELIRDRYRALWRTRRFFCRAGAVLMSNAMIADAGVDLLTSLRSHSRSIMSLVGK